MGWDRGTTEVGRAVCLFSIAVATNDHTLTDLTHMSISQFCQSEEAQHGPHWAKMRVFARLSAFLEAPEGNMLPCLFILLENRSKSLINGPFLPLQSQQGQVKSCYSITLSVTSASLFHLYGIL